MAEIAGAILMGGGSALQAFESYEAGKEGKRRAEFAEEQLIRQAGQIGTMTAEKLHDIERGKHFAKGEAKAYGALGGAKVGTGSSLTLLNRIEGIARRKSDVLAKASGFQRAELMKEAREWHKRGRNALKAGKRGAWSSLLTGGFQFGKEMSGWGT